MRLRFLKSYLANSLDCRLSEVMNMDEDFGVGAVMLSHLILENSVEVNKNLYTGIREGDEYEYKYEYEYEYEHESIDDQGKRRKLEKTRYVIDCSYEYLKSRESIQWKFQENTIDSCKKSR